MSGPEGHTPKGGSDGLDKEIKLMSKIEKSGKKESVFGRFKKDER